MRSLLTILMMSIGGTIGYALTDDPFYALVGGAAGIIADLVVEYQFMKHLKKLPASEARQENE